MTPDQFEERVRQDLAAWAEEVRPQGTLAQLRTRIRLWRLFHRRPRKIHRAARAVDPDTLTTMPPVPSEGAALAAPGLSTDVNPCQPTPRCVCGRPTEGRWCCWVCRAAADGGWDLGPHKPGIHWTASHTWACEQRTKVHRAVEWRRPPVTTALEAEPMHWCPAIRCPHELPEHLLFCGRHWRMVPRPLQRAVLTAWANGRGKGSPALRNAQLAAIRAVNTIIEQEDPWPT